MPKHQRHSATDDAASSQNRNDYILWDSDVQGLGQRVRPTRTVWLLQRRLAGKTIRKTLGDCVAIDLAQARTMALALIEREAMPENAESADVTFAAFVPRYLADNAGRWKPATFKAQKHGLALFATVLGQQYLASITRADVLSARDALTLAPSSINRAIAALSDLMRHAELMGLRTVGTNPCKGLRRHASDFKANYLSDAQYGALGEVLREMATAAPAAVACLRFLALTGCRRSEALTLEWGWIDGPRAALPDAKAGPKAIWLGRPVQRLLAKLPRTSLRVFAHADGRPVSDVDLDEVWNNVRARLGLPNLRLHDLRHSLASAAIGRGHSLDAIGGILGHLDRRSTAGYAHLNTAPVVAASARVGAHLADILATGRKLAELPESVFEDYLRSRDRLPVWCAARGIDPKEFAKALRLHRQARALRGTRS